MKFFVRQCPLCEESIEPLVSSVYPRPMLCRLCGATYMATAPDVGRSMTRLERRELMEKFPVLPDSVKQAHDEAVADKWG